MRRSVLLGLATALLALSSCGDVLDPLQSDDPGTPGDGSTGQSGSLAILMTDAPLEAKEVWVTLSGVETHAEGSAWKMFASGPFTLELLSLQNTQELLALGELEDGTYTGLRLLVQDGYVIDDAEERCDLRVPSEKIKVPFEFEVQAGSVTSVLLDFDAEKSVHLTRSGKKTTSCKLRPVLKVLSVETEDSGD